MDDKVLLAVRNSSQDSEVQFLACYRLEAVSDTGKTSVATVRFSYLG